MGFAEPDDDDVRVGSRNSERVQVWVAIQAGDSEGTITIIVRDLGITGARIETRPARFHSGDLVQLRLPLLPAERVGEVRWSRGRDRRDRIRAAT